MKAKRRDRKKTEENWTAWGRKAFDQIEAEGLLHFIEGDISAYNKGSIDAHTLVRRLYCSDCLEKTEKTDINISSMATFLRVLIAGEVFIEEKTVELKRASSAFEVYLTFREEGLIDGFSAELESYNQGNISAYELARKLNQRDILEKAKEVGRNVDSMGTVASALIAGGCCPKEKTAGLIRTFSNLDLFLSMKESGHIQELQSGIECYTKGEISAQTFAKKLLESEILSSLQDCGKPVDSINSVALALIAGGVIEEKKRAELSRYSSHLDLYRWLQKNGFLDELSELIESYSAGKLKEHAFISKLYSSGILSKIEESKKELDSIGTLVWAIAVGEDIPESKWGELGWQASALDLYRDMEKSGLIEELRPLTEAYSSGKISNYALIRQLHQTSILSEIQKVGRDVSYETLINALISGGELPYDSKNGLKWASGSFDLFRDITEDKNISAYLKNYCELLNARLEDEEISPALYALHISLLHDSLNQSIERSGRNINASTFSSALVSGGVIPESLERKIGYAISALQRAEAPSMRQLYFSSSSFSDFYRKMSEDWNSLREELKDTYTRGAPPEKPFSKSYANYIWQVLGAMAVSGKEMEDERRQATD